MVAYGFKGRFEAPIRAGTKTQTIRADRKRHARPGEEMQNYYAMRTKQCRLIGRYTCMAVSIITLDFQKGNVKIAGRPIMRTMIELDCFACSDGFLHWADLCAFWKKEHGAMKRWTGILIEWKYPEGEPA